jgi:hypothetical protein
MNERKAYVVIISSEEESPGIQIAYTREEAETIAMAWLGDCLLSELMTKEDYVSKDDNRTIGETFSDLRIVRSNGKFVYSKCGDYIIEIQPTTVDADRFLN